MDNSLANFIIAGVNKAGTTSVFHYLNAHPEVCGSRKKETRFFIKGYKGELQDDTDNYATCFSGCSSDAKIIFEATPGYLCSREPVVSRMRKLVPRVKLLFILREPISLLFSAYNYRRGMYRLPQSISFDDYVDKCIVHCVQGVPAEKLGISEGQLRLLDFGNYIKYLKKYYDAFPRDQIKIMFFEDLKADCKGFMKELCGFLEIDNHYYDAYEFNIANQTFHAKNKFLHTVSWSINGRLSPFFNRYPGIKRSIMSIYKSFNEKTHTFGKVSDQSRKRLEEYYAPANMELGEFLANRKCPNWVPAKREKMVKAL